MYVSTSGGLHDLLLGSGSPWIRQMAEESRDRGFLKGGQGEFKAGEVIK